MIRSQNTNPRVAPGDEEDGNTDDLISVPMAVTYNATPNAGQYVVGLPVNAQPPADTAQPAAAWSEDQPPPQFTAGRNCPDCGTPRVCSPSSPKKVCVPLGHDVCVVLMCKHGLFVDKSYLCKLDL